MQYVIKVKPLVTRIVHISAEINMILGNSELKTENKKINTISWMRLSRGTKKLNKVGWIWVCDILYAMRVQVKWNEIIHVITN